MIIAINMISTIIIRNKHSLKFTKMNFPQKTIFFFFLLSSLLVTSIKCKENSSESSDFCLTQVCSYDEPVIRYIQFPFVIKNESLPKYCGYPGFDLLCNGDDKLLINLPNSGLLFSVEEIDYVKQELWLNDPDNCLPRKLISLNNASNFVGKSPFIPVLEQVYWFHNCSNEFFNTSNEEISPISCLSGEDYGVFATISEKIDKGNTSLCGKIGPVRVPVSKRSSEMFSSLELEDDIMLTWTTPRECGECYQRHGKCRFKSISGLEVGCFNLPRRGVSRSAMFAIAVAFVTPLVMVTCCFAYFIMKTVCHRRRANRARLPSVELALAVAPHPREGGLVQGLDKSTIESYPKVVLEENRRLPNPNDNNCAICLGEYLAKETLKTIPDCGHCFHAPCIDEWLLLNASCPVCRNSPAKN